MRNLDKQRHERSHLRVKRRAALPGPSTANTGKDEKTLRPVQRQFAESYARAKRKLTGEEWAKRFQVTRRSITNWMRNPQVQEVIRQSKRSTDVTIDRDFVQELSLDERRELTELLDQQERIDSKPGGEYSLEELQDILVARAFAAEEQEVGKILGFLESVVDTLKAVRSHVIPTETGTESSL